MRKLLLFTVFGLLFANYGQAQPVYIDQFDDAPSFIGADNAGFSFEEADGELTISADGTTGPWDAFAYEINDGVSEDFSVDASGNNKLFIRAKATSIGTEIRIDMKDGDDIVTSQNALVKVLTNEYVELEFDFTGILVDGGFGGSSCSPGPCPVDASNIVQLVMFINPGAGGYVGDVVIDYISFGEAPAGEVMSDVFQDHFDTDSSLTAFGISPDGYELELINDTELQITGNGTADMWGAFGYNFRSVPDYLPIDVDVTGNHKLFVKMKSTVENTTIRIDVEDVDGFVNTQGSVSKTIGTEYAVYEYDFNGTYNDLGFGGTACNMDIAPCPLDAERIKNLVMFIQPGTGMFAGEVTIDYISFGTSLEPAGNEPELTYEDRFSNETVEFAADSEGYILSEEGSDWIINGDGTSGPFAATAYTLHDKETSQAITLDINPSASKLFVRMRTETGTEPVRIDLVDSSGLVGNFNAVTKSVNDEFSVYEYNYDGILFDGAFGGTACEEGTGPCALDPSAITTLLITLRPGDGGYDGTLYIDYVSFGQPLEGEDPPVDNGPTGLINVSDDFNDQSPLFLGEAAGYTTGFADGAVTFTGDGSNGMFAAINYGLHEASGDSIIANAIGSNDLLYVRARASVGVDLRIDLVDNEGFATTQAGVTNTLTPEYDVYTYNFNGNYTDGGFGGTACEAGPCLVDGRRIAELAFYVAPGVGAYTGAVDIDWVPFGDPLVNVNEVPELESMSVFPNPVTDQVAIDYTLLEGGQVGFQVYDAMGRRVFTQAPSVRSAGVNFDTADLSKLTTGLYHLQLNYNGRVVKSVTLMKK